MLSSRLREVGRFLRSDHEGILNSSLIQNVLPRRIAAMLFTCMLGMLLTHTTARGQDRSLSFYNIHTKESLSIVYKRNGSFDQEALQKLNHFMRDWRRNVTVRIDPALFDLIWEMYRELGAQKPIHVICGHRSSATNEGLRRTRGGQAKASRHITGQAIDLHFPDVSVKQLRNSALIRERGGVGYYPTSSIPFVHVDTGNVRHWPRLPRQELAILFPNGGSKHVPTDGRPLTKADFRMALAALQERGGELPTAVRARLRPENTPSTVLASLSAPANTTVSAPANTTPVAAVIDLPEQKPKPTMMLASLGTPFPKFGGAEPAAQKPPSLTTPVVSARAEQTSARPDLDSFTNDILRPNSQPSLRQDDDDNGEVEYDEDDHPDENASQPFPILPFMSDTPIASMDMSDPESDFTLAKVHLQFSEPKEMLDTRFRPGLQFAELFWAQRFRGGAINTALRRVDRDAPAAAVAEAPAPPLPVRTAQRQQPPRR
jgi:uncharacterized protein YcbK (DUF882 family)